MWHACAVFHNFPYILNHFDILDGAVTMAGHNLLSPKIWFCSQPNPSLLGSGLGVQDSKDLADTGLGFAWICDLMPQSSFVIAEKPKKCLEDFRGNHHLYLKVNLDFKANLEDFQGNVSPFLCLFHCHTPAEGLFTIPGGGPWPSLATPEEEHAIADRLDDSQKLDKKQRRGSLAFAECVFMAFMRICMCVTYVHHVQCSNSFLTHA